MDFNMHAHDRLPSYVVDANASRISKNGRSFFEVTASAFVRATPRQTWAVLTDYERLPEFVSDLIASRVVSRDAHDVVVEQRSKTGFLFLSQRICMLIRIEEQPYSAIDVTLIEGDMRHYAAHWMLTPATQDGMTGTRVQFTGALEPSLPLLPLFGRALVQTKVQKMVEAVVAEIERRSAH
jgi:ribosome-associated toxin RatA of RatAB toxin-antitoxin module